MNTETIEVEVLPPAEAKLVKYAGETGLEGQSTQTLVESFRPIFARLRTALDDAKGVAESVKDATCVREIGRSRACRLALRKVRLESDENRKKEKQHALLYGRAVDGFHAILLADLSPVETALREAEDIAERAEAKRLADLKAAREVELVPLLDEPLLGNLADLSEDNYMKKLSNAKLLRQAKLDAAAKFEAERKAQELSDRLEREHIAAENARLKSAVEARDAAYKAEREATRVAAEKKLSEERAEAARVAAEIKAKADVDAKAAAEQAARERAEIEAAARKEREAIQFAANEVARKAQVESARLADIARKECAEIEAKAKRDAEEAVAARAELLARSQREAADKERAEVERKAIAAAVKKAAAAPDKAKLQAFADALLALPQPLMSSGGLHPGLRDKVAGLVAWIRATASEELL